MVEATTDKDVVGEATEVEAIIVGTDAVVVLVAAAEEIMIVCCCCADAMPVVALGMQYVLPPDTNAVVPGGICAPGGN